MGKRTLLKTIVVGGDTELNTIHKWDEWGFIARRQGDRMDGKLLRNLVKYQGFRGKK